MTQSAPTGVDGSGFYASLDGDADRVLFFYFKNGEFKLLDGDRIAALFAHFIHFLSTKSGIDLDIGVVQTAYSNGNFASFIKESLGLPLVTTSTGVKHLHHEAKQFQVGIYFEANGHGTVLFQESALQKLNNLLESGSDEQKLGSKLLLAFSSLINQTVGDGIADLLCVISCLSILELTFEDWSDLYTELPNKQAKVKVKRKEEFKTTEADTILTEPAGLQEKINEIVRNAKNGRCFVRPSGTEDCVRIYAEAASNEEVGRLIDQVSNILK
jgi:phosphoacetylglucosamine mutase